MRTSLKILGFIGWAAALGAAAEKEAPSEALRYSIVTPKRLDLPSKSWEELQFIQADLEGSLFVLRGSPALEVYRLEGEKLRFVQALEGATVGVKAGEMWVEQARLSRAGDRWFLFVQPTTIEVFEGGKRAQTIESHWEVTDLAAGASRLVVAVSNNEINTSTPEGPGLLRPPWIREWDGKRWNTLVEGRYRDEETRPRASWHQLDLAAYSARLAFSPEGQFWIANAYSPRLRHYSASGVLEDEIVLGDGTIRWLDAKPENIAARQAEIDAALARGGFSARVAAPSSAPREACRGLAIGRDGHIYLLAETDQGLALDRYLKGLPTYERVLLGGLNLGAGRPSFVAGRHALLIGARFGKGGTWELTYEDLAAADWKSVSGATRNGIEIETRPAN